MKTHTAYILVPCNEGLPKEHCRNYLTNIGWQYFSDGDFVHEPSWGQRIDWWLEKREDVIVMTKEELQSFLAGESKTNFGQ